MKYSRTAIGLLTAQYRSVLKKCLLINLGLYALGAVSATPANAANGDVNLSVEGSAVAGLASGAKIGEVEGLGTAAYTDSSAYANANLSGLNETAQTNIKTLAGNKISTELGSGGSIKNAIDTATDDMATQTWVGNQGYQTSAQVSGAITTALDDGGSIKNAIDTATDDMATQTWVGNQGYQTSAQVSGAITTALDEGLAKKQNTLTAASDSNITLTNNADGTVSISATDTTYSAGNGITIDSTDTNTISVNLTDKGGLQLDAATTGSKTLSVSTDNATIVKDDTSGSLKVGTIDQSQVNGLDTALAAKTTIAASGTDNVYTIADSKATGAVSKDFYDVTGTNAAIAASAATKANLAGGNQFTGLQEFGVKSGTTFTKKASIDGETGVASFAGVNVGDAWKVTQVGDNFSVRNAANKPVFNITPDGTVRAYKNNNQFLSISETDFHLTKDANDYFTANTSNLMLKDSSGNPTFQVINSTGNVTAKGNVRAAGLTFDGTKTATGIQQATSGETASALTLATAGYAQEQAKTAANNVVKVNAQDSNLIDLNDAEGTNVAQTYTTTAIDTKVNAKYNYSAIVGTDAEQTAGISANTAVYSQAKSNELLGLKMNTADWTLANDATKLNGAKLGAGTVGFAALNPNDVITSSNVATATLDDAHLVTAGAVVAGITNAIESQNTYFTKEFGYDTVTTDAPTVLGNAGFTPDATGKLGFSQAIIQNKTAIGNIISAATKLDGIQMNDNSATSVAKTVNKIDNSVIYGDDQQATGDEKILATKATILAALDNPDQDITANTVTANEVDTKALKVADTDAGATSENVILEAKKGTNGNEIALNGATTVTGGLTTDTLTFSDTPGVAAQGIKTVVEENASGDSKNYLVTSDAVNNEFNTKVGTLTKNTGTADVPVYTTRSVADMIGVDANGALVFTEDTGVSNIASGDGTKSAPTTIVGAIENISSAMGMIHNLVTDTAGVKTFNGTVVASTNLDDSNHYIGNLIAGTSVSDDLVGLDNAIGALSTLSTEQKGSIVAAVNDLNGKVVHKTGDETIADVKTFSNVINANAGVKIGADWQMDENSQGRLVVRSASTTGAPAVVTLSKKIDEGLGLSYIDDANKGHEFLSANGNRFVLKDANGNGTFTVNNATGAVSTKYMSADATNFVLKNANNHGTFKVDNATGNLSTDGSITAGGDITTTGNVKAASLTLPNLDQTTAGATITAQAIDNSATAFPATGADTTLATLASVNNLAEKATFTKATGSTMTSTTIGAAINELQATKQAKLYYVDDTDPSNPVNVDMKAEVKTAVADATNAKDENLVTEKAIRTELDTKQNQLKNEAGANIDTTVKSTIADVTTASDTALLTEKAAATALAGKADDDKVVHLAGAETITGVKTFQNGLKVGADWQMDENPTTKAFVIRDASTAGMPAVAVLTKNAFALSDGGKTYFNAGSDGLVLKDIATATATTPAKNYFAATKTNLSTYDVNGNETFRVNNATGNVEAKGNVQAAGLTFDGTNIANGIVTNAALDTTPAELKLTSQGYVDGSIHGAGTGSNVTVGDQADTTTIGKSPASISVDTTAANHEVVIATAADTTKAAGMVADGDSVAIEATNGTNDFYIGANAETDKEGVAMGVTKANEDNLLSGFSATATSAEMGLNDETSGKMTAGLSVEKDASAGTITVEMGLNDETSGKMTAGLSVEKDASAGTITVEMGLNDANENLATGVKTEAGKVSILANDGSSTSTVMEIGSDTTNGQYVTINGNETVNGNIIATGDVKAASLTLPNLDQTTTGATITAQAIDNSATAFPTSGADTTIATLSSIQNLAAQGAYTPGDQNSWRNPYAGGASTKPTTIAGALDRLATNLDAATNSLGDWNTLDAYVHPGTGSPAYTGNITDTGSTPYEAPSAVSAIIDLDKSIGNRGLLVASGVHYTNPDSETSLSVSQAIANMDTKVYQDIHGTGTATVPAGHVKIGDNALTTTLGSGSYKVAVNSVQGQTVFGTGNPDKVVIKGGSIRADDAAGNQSYYKADGITVNGDKFTVDKNGNTVAAGSLTAAGGAFNVTPADATAGTPAQLTMNGNAQINGDENVTGDFTAANGNFAVRTASGKTTATTIGDLEVQKAGATPTTMFKVDSEAGTVVVGDASAEHVTMDTTGKIESVGANHTVTINNGDVNTYSLTMADADTSATAPATVTSIDKGTTATNSFSDAALATTQSIKTKAENADYTPNAALKAAGTQYATANATFINEAIKELDLQIGDWNGLNTENGNLTNGHAGDAGYNMPETVVDAFNNIDATLGTIHGLAKKLTDEGTYKGNLASGTTVEQHLAALDTSIGDRNSYTAQYNIANGQSVAESLDSIDLRMGDVKSLNNMHYYGEQNPADVNLSGAVRALDSNLYRVEHDLKTLRHDTYAGLASAAALSALVPNPRGTGDTTLSFGTGAYQGHTAAALGGFHWITNNLLVNAGVGWDNREATTRIGVSYSF